MSAPLSIERLRREGEEFMEELSREYYEAHSGLKSSAELQPIYHAHREILGPDTPIIVLSGDTSMPTLNSLPHVGATYFFSKPVNAAHLLERLKESVGGRSPEKKSA